jgi:tetratricopeptide (TPR) repeat protein
LVLKRVKAWEVQMRAAWPAAAAALILSASGAASGHEVVVGDLAAACSSAAKAGRSDLTAVDLCTRATVQAGLERRDVVSTFVNRGALYIARREWDLALTDFEEALRLDPERGAAHVGRGAYNLGKERFAEAEAEVNRGLQLGTEEPEKAYYIRAMARWGRDDLTGAYKDFRKAAELAPNWAEPKRAMANFIVQPAGKSGG